MYGVGYNAGSLVATAVSTGQYSIYTCAEFDIADLSTVTDLAIGADYDDGWAAWINGTLVYRSGNMCGDLDWDNVPTRGHESSNGLPANYDPITDISAVGLGALQQGANVLSVAVWNIGPGSSDLVVVPQLIANWTGSPPGLDPPVRGPYLQMGTSTSLRVRWRTSTPTDSRVRYGPAPDNLSAMVDDLTVTRDHEITLAGLSPDTKYFYEVGSTTTAVAGADPDHYFVTAPPTGAAKPTRLWVLGDSGTANSNAEAVRNAYYAYTDTRHTDLWLMLGDNAYGDGTDDEYQNAVFNMYPPVLRTSVLWPTMGNHDGHSANSLTQSGPYYDIFTLPRFGEAGGLASGTEAYYSFDYGNIHFICLESHQTPLCAEDLTTMMTWLENDLDATLQDWIIAFWHHPPYSKGSHDSDAAGSREALMRQNALPLLEAGGVDLVLSGHSHSYERSYLLDGHYGVSGTLDPATMILAHNNVCAPADGRIDGDGAYKKVTLGPGPHEGSVYVVAGSSGQISGGSLNHPAMYISLDLLGSMVIDIDGNRLDARFLDSTNTVQDHFTIVKGTGAPAPAASHFSLILLGLLLLASGRRWVRYECVK
jgi:hypothetical protein